MEKKRKKVLRTPEVVKMFKKTDDNKEEVFSAEVEEISYASAERNLCSVSFHVPQSVTVPEDLQNLLKPCENSEGALVFAVDVTNPPEKYSFIVYDSHGVVCNSEEGLEKELFKDVTPSKCDECKGDFYESEMTSVMRKDGTLYKKACPTCYFTVLVSLKEEDA